MVDLGSITPPKAADGLIWLLLLLLSMPHGDSLLAIFDSEHSEIYGARRPRFAQLPIAVLPPRLSHRGVPEGAFAWRLFPDVVRQQQQQQQQQPSQDFPHRREVRRSNVLLWIYRMRL